MVERIIELSVRHKWVVFAAVLVLALFAADSVRKTPLDALPDISDPQVIIYTEWMGRSPDLIEDQITYPLVRALQSTPGVQTVRGYSMFGMSFTYALFGEGTDIYWARTRVVEQLGRVNNAQSLVGIFAHAHPSGLHQGELGQVELVAVLPRFTVPFGGVKQTGHLRQDRVGTPLIPLARGATLQIARQR